MGLFKIAKKLTNDWYQETHTAITNANTHTDINEIKRALEEQRRDFFISRSTEDALWLLIAYCDLRFKHLTMRAKGSYNPTNHYLQTSTKHLS